VLMYNLEVRVLPTRTLQALDFTMNRVLMKLFKTCNIKIIEECRCFSHVELPSVQLPSSMFSDLFVTVVIRTVYMIT